MIKISVEQFCNHVVSAGEISAQDLRVLKREVIPDGLATREEADLLIALERAVPSSEDFADFLVTMGVDSWCGASVPPATSTARRLRGSRLPSAAARDRARSVRGSRRRSFARRRVRPRR